MTTHKNNLSNEKSPYLLSAAHQPVDWFSWSPEAFRKAKELDRPVLLDIGAVWCHWCHVIDRESYENAETAKIINDHFVAIKVDRDERPDIDSRYQLAVSAIAGQGGWPLTAFLTPSGDVFYGGTYFPPEDMHGRPGFKNVLRRVAEVYKERRNDIHEDAARLHQALKENSERFEPAPSLPDRLVDAVIGTLENSFDTELGGFGTAPKFPHPGGVDLLINRYFFSREAKLLHIVEKTLAAMAKGGVYDHIGGGFHRYSTDRQWIVPHFEKMLYDNSELLKNYVHAYQITGSEFYKTVSLDVMRFVNESLSDQKSGGFYGSQDADINLDDDGDYFTWTKQEAEAVLSPDEAKVVLPYFDIEEEGEMHHNPAKNVLHAAKDLDAVAKELGKKAEEAGKLLKSGMQKMLAARKKRQEPFIDRTLYVSWNGMMIQAYLAAYGGLGDTNALHFALKTLDYLTEKAYRPETGFYHIVSEGEARVTGLLEDQIQMALALLMAHEATGKAGYFDLAKKITDRAVEKFWDRNNGGFFDIEETGDAVGKMAIRQKSIQDSPNPSANAVAIEVLDRLYHLTSDTEYWNKSETALKLFAPQAAHLGYFAATFAMALDAHQRGPLKIVVVGEPSAERDALARTALSVFHPYKIVQLITPSAPGPAVIDPAVKAAIESTKDATRAKAYVCEGKTCRTPVENPEGLAKLILQPVSA